MLSKYDPQYLRYAKNETMVKPRVIPLQDVTIEKGVHEGEEKLTQRDNRSYSRKLYIKLKRKWRSWTLYPQSAKEHIEWYSALIETQQEAARLSNSDLQDESSRTRSARSQSAGDNEVSISPIVIDSSDDEMGRRGVSSKSRSVVFEPESAPLTEFSSSDESMKSMIKSNKSLRSFSVQLIRANLETGDDLLPI